MKKNNPNKLTIQQSLRKLGHMLALREQRGDNSEDYQSKKSAHDSLLKKLYS